MALVESAGAAFIGSSVTNATTSASFTPAANSLVVAIAANGNANEVTGTGFTISGTGFASGTWTTLVSYKGASGSGLAGVWCIDAGASPAAGTVTVTAAPSTAIDTCLIVRVFTGAKPAASQNGKTGTAEGTINTISITPNATGSQIVGGSGSGATGAAYTANAATSIYGQTDANSTMAVIEGKSLTSAGVAQVLGYTSTAQAVTGFAAAEILASGGAAALTWKSQPVRAKILPPQEQRTPVRGRISSNRGGPVKNPTPGPVFHPAVQALRAKVPLHFGAGLIYGSALTTGDASYGSGRVMWSPGSPPPVYPPRLSFTTPIRSRVTIPPKRGRSVCNKGTYTPPPAPFHPAVQAIRAKLPGQQGQVLRPAGGVYGSVAPGDFSFGSGRVMWSPGAPVRNPNPGPVFVQKPQPVHAAVPPPHPRAGRIGSSFGAPVENPVHGPPAYPLEGPVRARLPQLQPRAGRVSSNAGAPVRNPVPGPVFRQQPHPAQARVPLPPRGRTYTFRAATALVPSAGPVFRQATQALRAKLPQLQAHTGRVSSNPGAPLENPQMRFGAMPGYTYPSYLGSYWNQFVTYTGPLPSVVILNNGNGDVAWNSDYETLCTELHAMGITVLGYTYTIYGTRAAATVEAAVGNYLGAGITPGGNGVDGIFLDEFQSTAGGLAYYQGICASIQSQFAAGGGSATPPIWGNPGTWLDSSYLTLPVTTFITFEGSVESYLSITPFNVTANGTPVAGNGLYARSRFAHLVYGVARDQVDGTVDRAYANYAGWTFLTSLGGVTNPYGFIPAQDYLNDTGARVAAQPVANPVGIPPYIYPPLGPSAAAARPLPVRGRVSGNKGAPVQNPLPVTFFPLRSPVRGRIPQNAPRGRINSNPGAPVHNPVAGPVFHPAVQALRARLPQQPLLRGRTASNLGAPVRNPTSGPVFHPRVQPARAPVPQVFSKGRTYGNSGAPVRNPVQGVPFPPAHGPVRIPAALAFSKGRVSGNAGAPVRNPTAGPVFRQADSPARIRPTLPPRGRIASNPGAPVFISVTGPPFYPFRFPARARIPQNAPRGRIASNAGAPVRNPTSGPVFPGWHSPVRAHTTPPFSKGRTGSNPGAPVKNPTPGPVFRQATSPARIRTTLPPRGRIASNAGAPLFISVTGPVFVQKTSPARARVPQNAPRGRTGSNSGAPVHNPVSGPVFHPRVQPAQARIPQTFSKGRAASNPGGPVLNPPAKIYPLQRPVRIHPQLPPRGRTGSNHGGPVLNPPAPLYPAKGPVRAQHPLPPRGRISSNAGTPLPHLAPVYPLQHPIQARRPLPPKGRIGSNPGTPAPPPQVGPKVYPAKGPVQARRPLPPRGRVTLGNKGAPVRNPASGPVFRPAVHPIRAVIPQNAPRGRIWRNPGGPVENIPFETLKFRTGNPYFQQETGNPYLQWETEDPWSQWSTGNVATQWETG